MDIEPLLIRNPDAQKLLAVGPSKYWQMVKAGRIEVVGSGAMSRATFASVKKEVERQRAEAQAAGEKAA